MDKQALTEHFDELAHNNRALLQAPIRGILLYFRGLNYTLIPAQDTCSYEMCAENGILFLFPQYNPTCWMNQTTVAYVDAILDAAIEMHNLNKDIPVGIYGGSMGGYNAFHFALKSTHHIVAACVNCPCCNMEYELFANSTSILQKYFESAIQDTDDFRTYVHENSPLNMVEQLPKIPYRFAVGLKDDLLYPALHSLPMIEKMLAAGPDVTRIDFPEMKHCNYTNADRIADQKWVVDEILKQGC